MKQLRLSMDCGWEYSSLCLLFWLFFVFSPFLFIKNSINFILIRTSQIIKTSREICDESFQPKVLLFNISLLIIYNKPIRIIKTFWTYLLLITSISIKSKSMGRSNGYLYKYWYKFGEYLSRPSERHKDEPSFNAYSAVKIPQRTVRICVRTVYLEEANTQRSM